MWSTQSPANSAGVLEYCVRHQLVSSVSASAILEKLNKHGNIQSSSDYGAGLAGQVRTQVGGNFLFERAAGHLQSQMCDRVLNHAKEL